MASKKLLAMLNDQYNKELFSINQYISISSYFMDKDLEGIANFFTVQAHEESQHAEKFFKYIHDIDGKIEINALPKPKSDFKSDKDAFSNSLEHEKEITRSINLLVKQALDEHDFATHAFLNWFVTEQVEEEALLQNLLRKLDMIGDNSSAMYLLDAELATRSINSSNK